MRNERMSEVTTNLGLQVRGMNGTGNNFCGSCSMRKQQEVSILVLVDAPLEFFGKCKSIYMNMNMGRMVIHDMSVNLKKAKEKEVLHFPATEDENEINICVWCEDEEE